MANVDGNKRKAEQLGMPFGTATARLRKMILFSLIQRLGEDVCHQCNEKINSVDDLSIEHKKPWLHVSVELFWDLSNIAFSHKACNFGEGRRGKRLQHFKRMVAPEGKGWCSGHQDYLAVSQFYRNASNANGLHDYCIECKRKYMRGYRKRNKFG